MSCEYKGNGMREALIAVLIVAAVVVAPVLVALTWLVVER